MSATIRVNEIFHSIQGESSWTGRPCVFVRLTGCHLRCTYCDTEYAFREGTGRAVGEVVDEVLRFGCDLVEVTGGEPLLQAGVHELMAALCDHGCTVLVETSGACDISACDPRVIRIVDFKTPASGEVDRNDWANVERLASHDEVKFVICDRGDYEWARDVIARHDLPSRCREILLSPVFEQAPGVEIAGMAGLPLRDLAAWVLEDGLDVRVQTQLHKHIWDPAARGV
jgi:7-carboxy-7-deazaguanine synthase